MEKKVEKWFGNNQIWWVVGKQRSDLLSCSPSSSFSWKFCLNHPPKNQIPWKTQEISMTSHQINHLFFQLLIKLVVFWIIFQTFYQRHHKFFWMCWLYNESTIMRSLTFSVRYLFFRFLPLFPVDFQTRFCQQKGAF